MRPRRALLAVAALAALWSPVSASAAPGRPGLERAKAAILIDAADGHVFLQKDARERRAIASTTKLMTALLALERARPRQVFTAPGYSALPVESKIDLRRGERMTVQDLLEALLLESANDAAVTIADGVAGSRAAFVREMNERAAALGLADTSYANPIGLDDPDNYSTARDLAALAGRLMRNRRFARIVNMPSAVLESGARRRVVDNRNDLVRRFPLVDGIKTGHTIHAGYVLVGAARQRGAQVVSVVMGEPGESARDADTLALLRYGLAQYRRVPELSRREALAEPGVKYRDGRVRLVPARWVALTVRRGERIERRVDAPDELEGPLRKGEAVGSVTLLRDGRAVRRVRLVTATEVPGAGTIRIVTSVLGVPLTLLLLLAILVLAAFATLRLQVRLRIVRGGRTRAR
jgi:D-alanyl-D-alanine carboxypeptidase (penicillin-binding protein 5/6)